MSSDSPATILFDISGNPVGVLFDGQIYRLQADARITDGYNTAVITPPNTAAMPSDPALIVAISPNNPITTSTVRPSTSSTFSIASSISNVVLLPANNIRLGATIYNDSSSFLFIKLGTLASPTDFTIKLFPLGYYEIPFAYTGEINGVWSDIGGFARLDELTI